MSRFGIDECQHARVWAALMPDGELSELERRALRSHLHTCESCGRFATEVEYLSLLLRTEELTRPSLVFVAPQVVRRRRVLAARARPVAAVAAVALMAIGIAARAPLQVNDSDSSLTTTTPALNSERIEMHSLRVRREGALLATDGSQLVPMVHMASRPA